MRERTEPRITYRPLPGDLCGFYDEAEHMIVVDPRLTPRQRRITEEHERIHAERGDTCPHTEWLEIKMETAVDRELAQRLIPLPALIEAARWSCTDAEIAEELDVDEDLLALRIRGLTPTERRTLAATRKGRAA